MSLYKWDECYYKEEEDPDHPYPYLELTLREYEDDDCGGGEPLACICYDWEEETPWWVSSETEVVPSSWEDTVKEHEDPERFFVALYKACLSSPDDATEAEIMSLANTIYMLEQ